MNRRAFLASLAAGSGSLAWLRPATAQTSPAPPAAEQSAEIRASAATFLQTLAPARRNALTFSFPKGATPTAIGFTHKPGPPGGPGGPHRGVSFDTDGNPHPETMRFGPPPGRRPHDRPPPAGEQYGQAVWTNFPVGIVPRPGVRMGDLTATEKTLAHTLLKSVLSPMGYQKILGIMAADQRVADAGSDYEAGLATYTIALFGDPHATTPWMLQFGGHHLGLNVTFVGDKAVCSPLHTGILPARFMQDGEIHRALGRENDKAFALLATLTPDQLKTALIDHEVSDLIFGPGRPDATLDPQGLPAASMNDQQQALLLSLAAEWAGILNAPHAAQRLEEIRRSLPETRFAWSGPTTHDTGINGESYFRLHSPNLIIEHAPQPNQGGYKVHVHTIMRDLANDYAKHWV